MADQWFLKIDGVDGESTDAKHKGEIDILSWAWGLTQPSSGGGGGGAGKANFQDFSFAARISKASPRLFLAAAMGEHFKSAMLTGVRTTGKGKGNPFLTYKLSDVTVTSDQHSDSEGSAPTEQFALGYAKLEVTYTPTTAAGTVGPPIVAGFDLRQSKKV
jgi:type VI secretion system secreted protein Hcp